MFYEPRKNDHGLPYNPFKALIAPRPIGWVTTLSAKGEVNLAPYSFFNAVSDRPDIVVFSSAGYKDAITFAEETGEFVCNLATWDLRDAMNVTSAPLPRGQSELEFAGLTSAPCRIVKPPRVAESPVALECKWLRTIALEPLEGPAKYHMVIGEVVGATSTTVSSSTGWSIPPPCARSPAFGSFAAIFAGSSPRPAISEIQFDKGLSSWSFAKIRRSSSNLSLR
jgi:flavin reductase (DIM6/NTAB) family NADH-FMN oxidoreductase RutF